MGGFFADVFGVEEETEEDVMQEEQDEAEEAEESEEQRDAEQKRSVQCFQRMGTHRKLRLLSEESVAQVPLGTSRTGHHITAYRSAT